MFANLQTAKRDPNNERIQARRQSQFESHSGAAPGILGKAWNRYAIAYMDA